MTKVFAVLFALLTGGAAYLTMADVAVIDPTISQPSVRQGSVSGSGYYRGSRGLRGGYRGGK
ncbi:MAG: hypothetical protein KDK91_13715 [Gammaproteobacteria bacterium]|nr:hypothetical protein [Gammaproteobacteria bacterium]